MGIYDVESVFFWGGAFEQLHGSFSDFGAHLEFQKPELFMPELLLKELWVLLNFKYEHRFIVFKTIFT